MKTGIKPMGLLRLMICFLAVFFLSFSPTGGAEYGPTAWYSWYSGCQPPPPPPPPPPSDTTPPETTITLSPPDPSNSGDATFEFTSSEAGSNFYCQLDSGGFALCASPKDFLGLSDGPHTFEVKATDPAGNPDPTPALYTWNIAAAAPSPPSDLTAGAASASQIDLAWQDNSNNEDGFVLERKFPFDPGWAVVASLGPDITDHSDTGLSSGSTYLYRCRAYNTIGNSTYSNQASATTFSLDAWQELLNSNSPYDDFVCGLSGTSYVYTGTEIIHWGGCNNICAGGLDGVICVCCAIGGRYSLASATWSSVSTNNVPYLRGYHSAVWTGTEMIIWGGGTIEEDPYMGEWGSIDYLNSYHKNGGRYNPSDDSWTSMSTTDAPGGLGRASAIWTGTEMIVWGGMRDANEFYEIPPGYFNHGGRYNPTTDSWALTDITGAPQGRAFHTAVWTGGEMIVWGGQSGDLGEISFNDGKRYNPANNTWTNMNLTGAPSARYKHTAVWTGTEMIVWGGRDSDGNYFNDGARYNPANNSWTSISAANAPSARYGHTAVWTGTEMIVWGGAYGSQTGGRYNPSTDTWTPTSTTNPPGPRYMHAAFWTGTEMIIWGDDCSTGEGFIYTP